MTDALHSTLLATGLGFWAGLGLAGLATLIREGSRWIKRRRDESPHE